MPETVTITVKTTDLRANDAVVLAPSGAGHAAARGSGGAAVIAAVKRAEKYGTVSYDTTDRTSRVPLDAEWQVQRTRKTEAEKDAEMRAMTADWLRGHLDGWANTHPSDLMIADAEKNRGYARQLDWSNLPSILRAQALRGQAFEILSAVPGADTIRTSDGPVDVKSLSDDDLFAALAAWHAYVNRRRYPVDPTSRSSSTISNLLEDLDTWAIAEINQKVTDYGAIKYFPEAAN